MSLLDKILNSDLFKAAHGRYADNAKNRRLHRVGQEYGHAAKEKVPGPGRKPAQQDDEQKNPLAAKLDTLPPTQLSKIVETSEKKIKEFKDKGYEQGVRKLEEIAREAKKRLMGDEAYEKKDLVQRVKDTVSDEKGAGKVEQDWEDKIRDYIAEHYPTQANVTAETNSDKGRAERARMKNDPELKRMLEQQDKEFREADEREQAKRKEKKEPTEEKKGGDALDEIQKRFDALKGRIKELKKDGYDGEDVQAIEKQYRSLRRALRKMRKQQAPADTAGEQPVEKPAAEPKTDKKPKDTGDEVKVEARMAFDDIPMSGKVKMSKYLSDKRKNKVDKDFESIKNLDRDTIQTLHDGLVSKFNEGFDGMAKADRAEALYKIAKVKNELQKRPAEPVPNKFDSEYSGNWFKGDPSKMTKDELAERSVKHIQNFLQMNNLPVPEFVMSEYPDAKNKFQKTGHYSRKEGKVYLNAANTRNPVMKPGGMQWSYPGYKVDKTPLGVLAHEIGHHIDHTMKFDENAFPYKGEKVTGYEPTVHEAIAESLRLFMLNPDLLHTIAPKRYQYFLDNGLKPTVQQSWKDVLHGAPQAYFDQIDKNYSGNS